MIIQARTGNFVKLLCLLLHQFATSVNALLSMSFHIVGRCNGFLHEVFPSKQLVCTSSRNTWLEHSRYIDRWVIRSMRIHVECIPSTRDRSMMLVRPNQHSLSRSVTWAQYSAPFQPFLLPSTYTDKNKPCIQWANRHSQFFPSNSQWNLFKLSLPQVPSKWMSVQVSFKWNNKSSMFIQDLGQVWRGRRIHTSGHSDILILSNLGTSFISTWE